MTTAILTYALAINPLEQCLKSVDRLGMGVPSRVTDERFQARPARQRWSGRYDPMLTVDGMGAS
jgi:hypothetical protein